MHRAHLGDLQQSAQCWWTSREDSAPGVAGQVGHVKAVDADSGEGDLELGRGHLDGRVSHTDSRPKAS
jgi:hypothetical protein